MARSGRPLKAGACFRELDKGASILSNQFDSLERHTMVHVNH